MANTASPSRSTAGASAARPAAERSVVREAVLAGLLGAAAVALWFLVIDVLRGQPFFTPAALGSALFQGARGVAEVDVGFRMVALYSLVHVAAFLAVGWAAAALAVPAEREPRLMLAFVLLLVTMEVFVIGILAILSTWLLDALNWWTVAVANLLGVAAILGYLWQAHPQLRQSLGTALEDRE